MFKAFAKELKMKAYSKKTKKEIRRLSELAHQREYKEDANGNQDENNSSISNDDIDLPF